MLKNRLLYAALLIGLIFFHAFYTGWISWFLLIFTAFVAALQPAVSAEPAIFRAASGAVPAR